MHEVLLSKEDIEKISKVVAETLRKNAGVQINVVTSVISENNKRIARAIAEVVTYKQRSFYVIEVIREEEARKKINLDLIASSLHGAMDIMGQLQSWLSSQLSWLTSSIYNSITSWISSSSLWYNVISVKEIVSGIFGNVSTILSKVIDIASAVSDLPSRVYLTLSSSFENIRSLVSSVSSTVSNIASAVSDLPSRVYSTLSSSFESIRNLVSIVSSTVSNIYTIVSDLPAKISSLIGNVQSTLTSIISGIGASLAGLPDFLNNIRNAFTSYANSVTDFLSRTVPNYFANVTDFFTRVVPGYFANVTDFFTRTVPSYFASVTDFFTRAIPSYFGYVTDFFTKTIPNLFAIVSNFFTEAIPNYFGIVTKFFTETIPSFFGTINKFFTEAIPNYFGIVTKFFTESIPSFFGIVNKFFTEAIPNYFGIVTKFFTEAIPNFFGIVTKFFTEAMPRYFDMITKFFTEAIPKYFDMITKFFTEAIPKYFDMITKFFTEAIPKYFDMITKFFTEAIPKYFGMISSFFTETVPKWISSVSSFFSVDLPKMIENVRSFIGTLIELPKKAPDIIKDIATTIWTQFIKPTYDTVYNEVKQKIVDPILDKVKALSDNILRFGVTFQGFVNAMQELPRTLQSMWDRMVDTVWEEVKGYIERVKKGIEWFVTAVTDTFTKIAQAIYEGITGFTKWLYNAFTTTLTTIVSAIESAVFGAIAFIAEKGLEVAKSLVRAILNVATKVGAEIGKLITSVSVMALTPVYDTFAKWSASQFDRLAQKCLEAETPAENIKYTTEALGMIITDIVGVHYLAWGTSFALHRFASFCESLDPNVLLELKSEGGCAAEPAGIGVRLRELLGFMMSLGWRIKPAWMFREIAKDVRELSDTFTRGLMYGLTIWMTNPVVRILNAAFRDVLVIELPPVPTMQEIVRRHMPTDQFDDVLKKYIAFLKLYGYRTEVIKWITDKSIKIEVVDRFGTKRTIPLALIYEMPSASDVARMAIRDIFGMGADAVSAFLKVYSARGMHPDIGVLYYLLHYRYPPPERLWTFTTRAISGLLWATITSDMKDKIKAEANSLGAVEPTDARYWNFKAKEVFSVLQTYMTWHDYARFSWIRKEMLNLPANFTSDNQIIIDTLADIPTKIDQRWMIKWGLYEHLSAKGVTINSEVKEFATRVLEGNPASGIKMDITNFSRTLQATGLHPDWIPVTAVAETMNMLTEERTLLRTGFMNLFKEGFYDWKALEKLLAGFIKASFQVAYFDSEKMTWTTGWINLPVMFLPPERRLLELRALMDRALDILREIQRDVTTAYQEFIIDDYDEYKQRLSAVIDSVNEFYAKDYENITESTLPDELKLKFVEDYYKPYVRALDIWRDVYTIRRMRTWASRWLGWVIYRMAFGYVSKEDVNKVLDYVSKACKLAPKETDFIRAVMELLADIAKRDTVSQYLPTPSTMATLSEYITLDATIVEQVLTDREIPEYWKQVWLTYISVKPIKPDAKSLLSAYVRAFRYGAVTKDELDNFVKSLKQYGFTDREINFISKRVELEERILATQEYVPTLSTIATMLEYVSIPKEWIEKVFTTRNVPDEWKEVWMKYYEIRPIADDVRVLTNTFYRAKRYQIELGDLEKKVLDILESSGMTKKELEIRDLATQIEVKINEYLENRREYIPTPSMLATMLEYVSIPKDKIEKVFAVRGVPDEWKEIWMKYYEVRPIADDVKSLLSTYIKAFRYGAVTKDELDNFVKLLKQYGFTDKEIEFISKRIELEEQIITIKERAQEYVPTLSTIATMLEYVSIPKDTIEKVFTAKGVPETWREIWAKYYEIRPIADDVRILTNAYYRAKRYKIEIGDLEKRVTDILKSSGMSEKELEIRDLVTQIEIKVSEYLENRREYIPTPSMLATINEYVSLSDDLIKKALDARNVPADWQEIWKQYITARALSDDIRGLLDSYRRASIYVVVPDDIKKKVEDYAKKINFTQTEWDILNLRVQLEELILEARENRREYIPTPLTLAMLCEYLPEARDFFDDVVKAKRIPKDWQELWAKYIDIRPLVDDMKRYLARAEDLYVRFMIKKDDFEKILNDIAKQLGYTPKEVEFLKKVTEFERYKNAWIELIGTVNRLVELSEYSPTASEWALGKLNAMIDALPLSDDEKKKLKTMWEEYIRNRPVKSEAKMYITQLINAYVDGILSESDFDKELQSMKKWGFSDTEIQFYKQIATVRRARKLRIPLVYGE